MRAMYRIIISAGRTERILTDGLTYDQCVSICEDYNWMFEDGGLFWDMYIEEM